LGINSSDLLMWREAMGRYRYQTTNSKIANQMKGRKAFHLAAISSNEKLWIFYCDLPDTSAAKKRFRGLSGRTPKYDMTEEIYC